MEEKVKYGYIENGVLHVRTFSPRRENVEGSDGTISVRTVSVEEQVAATSGSWKPVDAIDFDKMHSSDDEDYIMKPKAYDAGDHIAYEYVKTFDSSSVRGRIAALREELAASDFKVLKCYEASLLGEALPYDMETLHAERQAQRDKINALQEKLVGCSAGVTITIE